MIPSDHFVRYYNEVFKALEGLGRDHLERYWRELGKLQIEELGETFRKGGLKACYDYWSRIQREENCVAELNLTDDCFEFIMRRCPSLSKALDNDAGACDRYCDHCMAWIEPVMRYAGLHAVLDMKSRAEPHCVFRVYRDLAKAEAWAATCELRSQPYGLPDRP